MSLSGSTNEEKIWNYLLKKIGNACGAAGLMGNLYAESALQPNNLENLCEQRLKAAGKSYCTDERYTAAVDNGTISRVKFLNPLPGKVYGYGLAQWTSTGRKAGLYDLAKKKGVSIADLEMQLDYLMQELSTSYKAVFSVLKTASSVRLASDEVLKKFECPANTGESVCKARASYGQKYYDKYHKEVKKSLSYSRNVIVKQAKSWIGCKESDGTHKQIIDVYNAHTPLARGYSVKYTDAWCATFVSAVSIKCGYTAIIPTECGCDEMIKLFQQLGEWQEDDSYTPAAGDVIFYDWQDSGSGDNTGGADHVGIVEKVSGSTITVIEGNYSDSVKRRTMKVNGKYIRGYGVPKYTSSGSTSGSGSSVAVKTVTAADAAQSLQKSLAGTYQVTASSLNVRTGAGTGKEILVTIPEGTKVQNYGYYTAVSGVKWLYVQFTYKNVKYTGFCSSEWLKK